MVGPIAIGADTVGAVAAAQRIGPREALERVIRDTVFAQGAEDLGLDRTPEAEAAVRGALGRAVLEALKKDASRDDPNDAEVAEATARHFVELDRPEAFRVVQVVVQVSEKADTAKKARARALAERFADRISTATGEADFRALAESVSDRGDFEVEIQSLKPVAADGRVVDVEHPLGNETYVPAFARAASRLTQPGQKSGVFATAFGFHAIMLLERMAAHSVPLDERRRLLRDEIATERAKQQKKERIDLIRSTLSTSVERSADALLSAVDVTKI